MNATFTPWGWLCLDCSRWVTIGSGSKRQVPAWDKEHFVFFKEEKNTHKNQKHFAYLIVEAMPGIVKRLGCTGYRDVSCAGRETFSLSCGWNELDPCVPWVAGTAGTCQEFCAFPAGLRSPGLPCFLDPCPHCCEMKLAWHQFLPWARSLRIQLLAHMPIKVLLQSQMPPKRDFGTSS